MSVANLSSESFKTRDARSYDPVVEAFDRFSDRLSGVLAARMVELARPHDSARVLDVGTGTGVVALRLARGLGAGGEVLGIDLSEGMLRVAAAKADREGLGKVVRYEKMDAERLALPDRSRDLVVSLFALLHFPDPLGALREMHRVLRPGGALVLGIGSGPPLGSVRGWIRRLQRSSEILLRPLGRRLIAPDFLNELVRRHLPADGEPDETDLARSWRRPVRAVRRLVLEAGFSRVRTRWDGFVEQIATPEEFWELQSTYSSLARKRISTASPGALGSLRREFDRTCEGVVARGGKLLYPYGAAFFCACRPA